MKWLLTDEELQDFIGVGKDIILPRQLTSLLDTEGAMPLDAYKEKEKG